MVDQPLLEDRRRPARRQGRRSFLMAALATLPACASVRSTERQRTAAAETHRQPERILVYDFAANADDLPPESRLAQLLRERPTPSAEEQRIGRRLGELTSAFLVDALVAKNLPAVNASTGAVPRVGDGVVRGEFVRIAEGSAATRMIVGLGYGKARLDTVVEAFEMTPSGLVPLGSAVVETAGGQMPGILVSVGVGAAAAGAATGSAMVSGGANVGQEFGPESIEAAAQRTANEVADLIHAGWRERGWS